MKSLNYIVCMFVFCASLTAFGDIFTCPDTLTTTVSPSAGWQAGGAGSTFSWARMEHVGMTCYYSPNDKQDCGILYIFMPQPANQTCSLNIDQKSFTCTVRIQAGGGLTEKGGGNSIQSGGFIIPTEPVGNGGGSAHSNCGGVGQPKCF